MNTKSTYYLGNLHPHHPLTNAVRLTARTDSGARRQAMRIDPEAHKKIYCLRHGTLDWEVIDRT